MTDRAMAPEPAGVPYLVVKANGQTIGQVPLEDELTIGRADDNDLKLSDPKVSRHHALLAKHGTLYMLTDLGSANGTWVEGVRLTCPHPLRPGQRIIIGDVEITYREPGKSTDQTLVAPIPIAVRPTVPDGAEPDGAPQRTSPPRRIGQGRAIGLLLAGGGIVLVLAVAALYTLVPALFGTIGIARRETALPTAAMAEIGRPPEPYPMLGTTPSVPPVSAEELDDRLAQAATFAIRSRFEEAIALYQDLVGRAPGDARPQIGWAWALILDGRAEEALAHAQKAVELDPASVDAAVVLARVYVDLEDKAQALAQAENAVRLGPGHAAAHAVLAEAYRLNGRFQEAVDEADLALVQDINEADAHRIRAWLYYLVDEDIGRAVGELHIAAGLQTELWLRRHELGLMLLNADNETTAIVAFQDALKLRPKAVTYTAIGEAYYRLGQYDPARASLLQAIAEGAEDAHTYALLAVVLAHEAHCADARAYLDAALDQDPENVLALEAEAICRAVALTPSALPAAPSPNPEEPLATRSASLGTAAAATAGATAPASGTPTPPSAAWPVSGRIAFPVWNDQTGRYDVYVAQANGTGRHLVAEGMDNPAFSPDGEWLAVRGLDASMRNLFIIRPDGTGLKQVTENREDRLPSWSPDNTRLVFASTKDLPDRPKALYIVDPVPFIGHKLQPSRRVDSGPGPVQAEYATWMPDGRLVYQGCDYTVDPQTCGLFTIAPGGGPFTQLTHDGRDTAPSGFNGRIAFMSSRDGNWEIYVVGDDGKGLRRLTHNASDDGLPVWSPDGKTIAFVSNQGGPWAIWAMNPDGSHLRKLFDIGGAGLVADWTGQRITWAP